MTLAPTGSEAHFTCVEDEGAVVVTFLRSQLTDEDNIEQMGDALFALLDKDAKTRIILDLSPLDYVTSSVLGKFITLHRRLHRQGGVLVLCSLQPNVREALRASRLLEYFVTTDSLEAARAALTA